jgi:chromate transport protein ChrA
MKAILGRFAASLRPENLGNRVVLAAYCALTVSALLAVLLHYSELTTLEYVVCWLEGFLAAVAAFILIAVSDILDKIVRKRAHLASC